jgi:site-specific DNA recombinase
VARVVTYCRVSTEEQATHGHSLAAQREALCRWASTHGHDLLAEFADRGISAWDTSKVRPGVADLLIFCSRHQIDLVAVYSFDRFSRDLTQGLLLRRELERHGTRVVSITEPADPDTAEGRLLISILGSFAQFFSDQNSAKTKASMRHKAAQGKSTGGTVPYGYRLEDGVYVLGPAEEVQTVRLMFELAVSMRCGVKEITTILNGAGRRGMYGRRWSNSTVGAIVKNRAYVGDRVWGKTRTVQTGERRARIVAPESDWSICENAHEAIIEREVFERRQAMAKENGFEERKTRRRSGDWLLSGLLHCVHCDGGYTGYRQRKNGVDHRYYVCNTRLKQGVACCPARRYLRADELEATVLEAIRTELVRPDRLESIKNGLVAAFKTYRAQNPMQALRKRLEAAENRITRILRSIEEGVVQPGEVQERLAQLRSEREQAEVAILESGEGDNPLERALEFVDCLALRFQSTFDNLAFSARQDLIRSVVRQVAIDQEGGEITVEFHIKKQGEETPGLSSPWSNLAPLSGPELGRATRPIPGWRAA